MNWQPMATAPKDIVTVLDLPSLALKNGKRIKVRGEGEEFLAAWADLLTGMLKISSGRSVAPDSKD